MRPGSQLRKATDHTVSLGGIETRRADLFMFIIRAGGYSYSEGRESRTIGYLTKYNQVSIDPSDAIVFKSEAEAWDYALASGIMGSDESGEWAWVEELVNVSPK